MVKRRKEEDIVGVLEFAGRAETDPEFVAWMADHRARNGGKVRVGKGATGVRVSFAKEADMEWWRERAAEASGAKPKRAATAAA